MNPTSVRYIKLGEGGRWLDDCLERGRLRFVDIVPHNVAQSGDWNAAGKIYTDAGRASVTDSVREIQTFYEAGADCLWVTFGRGRLWWAFAEPGVHVEAGGARVRRTAGPWSCKDVAGAELAVHDLSTLLTQTAAYQRTICKVAAEDYLLRRLNAEPDPLVGRLEGLEEGLRDVVGEMVSQLQWRDFEVLVDLIFTRGGWNRLASVGGSGQADSDLIMFQPITGERAFVQIKSKADAAILKNYLGRFGAYPKMDRFYFACHTPLGALEASSDPRVTLWLRDELAAKTLQAGLLDWLKARLR